MEVMKVLKIFLRDILGIFFNWILFLFLCFKIEVGFCEHLALSFRKLSEFVF